MARLADFRGVASLVVGDGGERPWGVPEKVKVRSLEVRDLLFSAVPSDFVALEEEGLGGALSRLTAFVLASPLFVLVSVVVVVFVVALAVDVDALGVVGAKLMEEGFLTLGPARPPAPLPRVPEPSPLGFCLLLSVWTAGRAGAGGGASSSFNACATVARLLGLCSSTSSRSSAR